LGICLSSDVFKRQSEHKILSKPEYLDLIVSEKTISYGDRHKRAFEAIASSSKNTSNEKFYYTVIDIILEGGYDGIADGIQLGIMLEKIRSRSKSNSIKPRAVKNSLISLHKVQAQKGIMPPILYFDENAELLSISDSTLYFFLKNADLDEFRLHLERTCGNRI
jgi:hypothetical protein